MVCCENTQKKQEKDDNSCVCEKKVVILQAILRNCTKDGDSTQHSTNSGSCGPSCPLS